MKEQYMDTEKASAILQEHDYVKRDAMIDALTEEEAKVFVSSCWRGCRARLPQRSVSGRSADNKKAPARGRGENMIRNGGTIS